MLLHASVAVLGWFLQEEFAIESTSSNFAEHFLNSRFRGLNLRVEVSVHIVDDSPLGVAHVGLPQFHVLLDGLFFAFVTSFIA